MTEQSPWTTEARGLYRDDLRQFCIVPDAMRATEADAMARRIARLLNTEADILALLLQVSAPGGIGPHEFTRPGGFRERVLAAIATATKG